jgi:hypothetical protein
MANRLARWDIMSSTSVRLLDKRTIKVHASVDANSANDSAIALYTRLRITCQIASYAGLILTAGLGTFDLFFKKQHEEVEAKLKSSLNRAGKTHLAIFLTVSFLTILSTIGKDLATSKLDAMSREKAQAELRQALGGDIRSITNEALAPAVTQLASTIETQTSALGTSISQSESSLNGAVKRSGESLHQIVAETSAETALATMRVGRFDITAEFPDSMKSRPTLDRRSEKWRQVVDAHCDSRPASAGPDYILACDELERQIVDLDSIRDFIASVDPTDSSDLAFTFRMRGALLSVYLRSECDPFKLSGRPPILPPHCIEFSDAFLGSQGKSFDISGADSDGGIGLGLAESGMSPTGHTAGSKPLDNVFGRDLDLEAVVIMVMSPKRDTLKNVPRHIQISERLAPLEDKMATYRHYELSLETSTPGSTEGGSQFVRYVRH